jgi:hypothetical protein
MTINEYRREFAAYNSEFELAHYKYRAGLETELNLESIFERYSDLFTKDAIKTIKTAKLNTPGHQATEIAAMRNLLGAICLGFLEKCAREVTSEVARCEGSIKITWNNETLSVHKATSVLANETFSSQRRELHARWSEAIGSCSDLRAARFEEFRSAARELGFETLRDFYQETKGVNYEKLATQTDNFLTKTETVYFKLLREIISREMPDVDGSKPHYADFFYFNRMAWLDSFFPKENLKRAYIGTMNELGIKVEKQANIKIDDELRPQKTARASCFRIHPPDDIRLLVSPIGGAYDYRTFFHEAGHAQHFSWVSPTLFERYPEFIYPPENATTESFAFLFQNLFNDPIWLSEHLPNLREEQARKIARELSLITLFSVRRAWAKLRYEIELHGYTDIRSEKLSASYSSLQTQATGFERDGTLYVWDVDDGFYCTAYLRAWAFEAGFREHLKTRHGRRWWRERKAADALVDIWNVGCRYSVEELAKQIGFNEISFDFLADDLIKAIREE